MSISTTLTDEIYSNLLIDLFSYQQGPDTYLLQLRDTDFPTRLREYFKVAKGRSPSFNYSISESNFDQSVS